MVYVIERMEGIKLDANQMTTCGGNHFGKEPWSDLGFLNNGLMTSPIACPDIWKGSKCVPERGSIIVSCSDAAVRHYKLEVVAELPSIFKGPAARMCFLCSRIYVCVSGL